MLRHGIRRCAGVASCAASRSAVLRSRATLPPALAAQSPCIASKALKSIASAYRLYSSEAVAPEGEQPEQGEKSEGSDGSDGAEITKFTALMQRGVHTNLLTAITRDMKYQTMTPVQSKTIIPALKGVDIVAQAKTGTGKTLAFLLPLLQRMIEEDPALATRGAARRARPDDIRGIILSPTRELAEQIAVEARRLCYHTGLVVQCAVGGTHKATMLRTTQRQGCHLMVATPGRLKDLLEDPTTGIDAPNLAALVLDEADRMLDVGFEKELNDIISFLPSPKEKTRQTLLVSATIPDNVIRLARTMIRPDNFEFVQTIGENEGLTHERVPQHIVPVSSWANVLPSLFEFLDKQIEMWRNGESKNAFKAIVYFNTTCLVELASDVMYLRRRNNQMKASSFSIHSKLTQGQRTKAAESFRNAHCAILLSSDVTARGMDFPNVTHVIQVDAPRDRESYIHRLGRTARQDKEGEGWLLAPQVAMHSTRRLLGDLPMKLNESLECAKLNPNSEEFANSRYHQEVKELMSQSRSCFNAAYRSMFGLGVGTASSRSAFVDDINLWAIKGCGLEEPPPVSAYWARQQGLMDCNVNIRDGGDGDGRRGRDGRDGRDGGRGRGFGFVGRSGGRDDKSDPFATMGRQIRRDGDGGRSSRDRRTSRNGNVSW